LLRDYYLFKVIGMPEVTEAKPKWAKNKKYMLVRYSRMNTLGFFEHNENKIPKVNARVVVETERGLELGYLVGQISSYRAGRFRLSDDQVKKYFDDSGVEFSCEQAGKFVRYATAADINEQQHLQKIAKEEIECCKRFAKEMNLLMKIVDAEHILGGERLIFYFMADGRVDFRELVKRLAQEYQTRIEMRQIGSRDEAKLLGDMESCGQECCCRRFLKLLKPVNMRMAKMQKATLDPSKISGYCGRLKCCLRYEDKTYVELRKRLPKKNTRVKTEQGEGKVVDIHILTQLVAVEYEDGRKEAIPVDEIELISGPANAKTEEQNINEDNEEELEEQ
jgi:cell fate regulator YaaT (PSP1 superfamily)